MIDFDLRFNIEQIRQNLKNTCKEQNPAILEQLIQEEVEKLERERQRQIRVWLSKRMEQKQK
jgi:hypothetical protein